MIWIFRILKAAFALFALMMTVIVICAALCAGRNRNWEEDDRAQMEALRELKDRKKTRN